MYNFTEMYIYKKYGEKMKYYKENIFVSILSTLTFFRVLYSGRSYCICVGSKGYEVEGVVVV